MVQILTNVNSGANTLHSQRTDLHHAFLKDLHGFDNSEVYLTPGNERAPRAACDSIQTKPHNAIAFLVGSNEFWSTRDGESDIITLDETTVVSMAKSERGILF